MEKPNMDWKLFFKPIKEKLLWHITLWMMFVLFAFLGTNYLRCDYGGECYGLLGSLVIGLVIFIFFLIIYSLPMLIVLIRRYNRSKE